MRIGIVSKWFNRGQPVVGRQLRSAVDELGHESFVLARPKRDKGPRPGALDRDGVWDQPRVTEASAFEIPEDEYLRWGEENSLDAAMFDNHYQFAEIAALRSSGVRTIGRFVWEHFSTEHVEPAREAFDVIYSMTHAEHARYAEMGIEAFPVQWGCHPEMTSVVPRRDPEVVRLIFPGGFVGHRKPLAEAVEAFAATSNDRLRLLVKAQVERRQLRPILRQAKRDPRIELLLEDQPTAEHYQAFADCDVALAPARWEGLGLPLFEATAFGMPIITNDDPPMNEVAVDGLNALLVGSHQDGTARSGIPAMTPDVGEMTEAIERVADDGLRAKLAEGATEVRERRSWSRTLSDLSQLFERAAAVTAGASGGRSLS
jgi:glycosyltransferase involved in cell wall biosynthesis